jgi:iron-sulfur cluster repair protein YtfE (RIC family)
MIPVTQPLRDEHKMLLPHVDQIAEVADWIGEAPVAAVRQKIEEICDFLLHHLIPHAQAEDEVLYPLIDSLMGTGSATATMSREHEEIHQLVEELCALRSEIFGTYLPPSLAKGLRRVMYGLYALVKVHFVKEEEVYLPLLEQELTEEEGTRLFATMERAAEDARRHLQMPNSP